MKRYETKSVIIGRKKDEGDDLERPCFISFFSMNNPHLENEVPDKRLDFDRIHRIIIKDLDVNYLLPGNDLVINDLEHITIELEGPHITIKGKQKD